MENKKKVKTLTKEELLRSRTGGGLTVGDLRNFLEKNRGMSNDAPVVVERVEDHYYENNGWSVYKKGGDLYYNALRWNKDIDSGKYLDKDNYPNMKEENLKKYTEEDLDDLKSQYTMPFCCFSDEEGDILFINLHY